MYHSTIHEPFVSRVRTVSDGRPLMSGAPPGTTNGCMAS